MPLSLPKATGQTWRADRRQGVFETLLVLDGRPVDLDAHLARLHGSLTELYPDRDPPPLDVSIATGPDASPAPGVSVEALRIAVAPGADGELAATFERRPANERFAPENGGQSSTEAVSLRSLRLPGGLGEHKWADRSLLDEAQAGLPSDALPLIVDADGAVLEASRANVFAVRDGALLTPPLDGRVLPGITRMRVLELAAAAGIEAREVGLGRADLHAADAVFLTGSVRGIEPADHLDGRRLAARGDLCERLTRLGVRRGAGREPTPWY